MALQNLPIAIVKPRIIGVCRRVITRRRLYARELLDGSVVGPLHFPDRRVDEHRCIAARVVGSEQLIVTAEVIVAQVSDRRERGMTVICWLVNTLLKTPTSSMLITDAPVITPPEKVGL